MSCVISHHQPAARCRLPWLWSAVCVASNPVQAQFGAGFRNASVGGVKIDADGVVSNPQVGELKQLQSAWQKGLEQVPADLQKWTDLRFVSLKQIESEIAAARAANKPLPDAVRFLGRVAARQVRARVSRPARHRARRSGRRLEGRHARQRRRRDDGPAGAHARRLDGRASSGRIVERERHQLLDRPDAGRPAAHAADCRPVVRT